MFDPYLLLTLTASAAAHVVMLVAPAGNDGVDWGSVTIPPSAATVVFAHATLSSPVQISANQAYTPW